ncbi:MAG: hypothetical protein LKI80_06900 [Sporolactobacillus sp.]|nr:hypothetical protein [Sporolactobacillus sp.]
MGLFNKIGTTLMAGVLLSGIIAPSSVSFAKGQTENSNQLSATTFNDQVSNNFSFTNKDEVIAEKADPYIQLNDGKLVLSNVGKSVLTTEEIGITNRLLTEINNEAQSSKAEIQTNSPYFVSLAKKKHHKGVTKVVRKGKYTITYISKSMLTKILKSGSIAIGAAPIPGKKIIVWFIKATLGIYFVWGSVPGGIWIKTRNLKSTNGTYRTVVVSWGWQ